MTALTAENDAPSDPNQYAAAIESMTATPVLLEVALDIIAPAVATGNGTVRTKSLIGGHKAK